MNVPNLLTVLRILLIPVFIICLLYERLFLALVVFVGAGITDGLDGMIARLFHQRTPTGEYLDPIADKLLLTSAFIALAVLKMIPSWLTVIVIARDVIIVLGILILLLTSHKVEISPIFISKVATCFQIATIGWALLTPYSPVIQAVLPSIVWVTAIVTCMTGLQYIYIGTKYLNEHGG
jgi:cardiolipin synthase